MEKIRIGQHKNCSGFGDLLMLTPICRYFDCIVELHPEFERFKDLFEGIAEVEIKDPTIWLMNTGECNHATISKLLNFISLEHIPLINNLPYVKVMYEDIKWAKEYLDSLNLQKPPIVLKPNCSISYTNVREMSIDNWKEIIEVYKETYSILEFGTSDNFTYFENTIAIPDLTIKQLKGMYYLIGKYIGVDTGDYHLMLATGGSVIVLLPFIFEWVDNGFGSVYDPRQWQYRNDKCQYVEFKYYKTIIENNLT
jgi:hypothetical protein